MKISKASWHYRFLRSFMCLPAYEIRDDLCGYMRQLVMHVMLMPLYGLALAAMFMGHFFEKGWDWLVPKAATAWEWFRKPEAEPSEERESLIGAWLRAKKDRLCPMIEFTDPSE